MGISIFSSKRKVLGKLKRAAAVKKVVDVR